MTNCESNFPDQRGRRGDILVRYKGIDKREGGGGGVLLTCPQAVYQASVC